MTISYVRGALSGSSALVFFALMGVCTADAAGPATPVPSLANAAQRCVSLGKLAGAALGEPTARIVTATFNPPSPEKKNPNVPAWMGGTTPAMPEHCEVIGAMRERTGSDGQHYAVKFHLRMPTKWNGRFLFTGGGGTNGMLGEATGGSQPGKPTSLDLGYAIVSTDTGHDNATNSDPARQGTVAFGHDYQARLEYSEKALNSVATTAKLVVRRYYGHPASHNYFYGCSNGGREGMVFAQRFPNQFDGIMAEAPAFAVPKAAIAEANDTQAFGALAIREGLVKNGLPVIMKTFSDADFRIVADAVAQVCDADDGVVDGMIGDITRCTTPRVRPALEAKICTGAKTDTCLTRDQVDTLVRSLDGPHNSKGEALYSHWPWDVGVASPLWRMWKIGMPGPMGAINVELGSPALSGLFVTPPETVAATPEANMRYQLDFDFDRDAPKIFATTADFPRSGWDLVGAQSTDLSAFRKRGGKLIVPQGGADPIFSLIDTISWWNKVDAANGGKASSFVRVFPVPGMNHCTGGPATDQFEALTSLVTWVEKGKAPDHIDAKAGPMTPWPGRTRPLCAYPTVVHYKGGDINHAESFTCVRPKG